MTEGGTSTGAWGENLRWWREDVQRWSRKEFCEQVEAMAHRTKEARGINLDEKMVWRWESGQVKRPRGFDLRILSAMGAPLPPRAGSAVVLPRESLDVTVARLTGNEDDEDMDRRGFLRGACSAATVAIVCSDVPTAIPSRIGPAHIRNLRVSVDELYAKDQNVGGAALTDAALHQYRLVRRMLDEGDYGE